MPGKCLFLYNSQDRAFLRALVSVARRDLERHGLEPWWDSSDTPVGGAPAGPGLSGETGFAAQILGLLEGGEAEAVVYCVGPSGPGAWQAAHEAPAIERAIAARRPEAGAGLPPLAFVPALLPGGELYHLPAFARDWSVANAPEPNRERSADAPGVWARVWPLLARAPRPNGKPWLPEDPRDPVTRLHRGLERAESMRTTLTLFIGPYALAGGVQDKDELFGPTALAQRLLAGLLARRPELAQLALWPSEAAELARLDLGGGGLQGVLREALQPLERNPPEFATSIAELARAYQRWHRAPQRNADAGWHGLLLLTTRVDLALERRLHEHNVLFTRYLPTVRRALSPDAKKKLVQRYDPSLGWQVGGAGLPSVRPWRDAWTDRKPGARELDRYNEMVGEASVVLVKLCGSIEVEDSIVHNASKIASAVEDFEKLPDRLQTVRDASHQVLLGRGFASPLLQLVQNAVLKRRAAGDGSNDQGQERIWVMPPSPLGDGATTGDVLCDLELAILDNDANTTFERTLDADPWREDQPEFVRRLAARFAGV